jgi:hypothetical protein
VIEPIGAHKQTLVWLTGVGDLKTNFKHIFDMMTLRGVRLVVPQSPMLPVSAFGEKVMPTWFDMPARISRESDPLTIDEDRIGILLV